MTNTKISQAYSRAALQLTDMIPVAAQGQLTAYHITGQALFDSLPAANTAETGVVELATAAETAAGTHTDRAVTPASLANAIGPSMIAAGMLYIGYVETLSAPEIAALFSATVGRNIAHGDLLIWDGPAPDWGFYLGVFHAAAGKIYAFNMRDGTFVHFP